MGVVREGCARGCETASGLAIGTHRGVEGATRGRGGDRGEQRA